MACAASVIDSENESLNIATLIRKQTNYEPSRRVKERMDLNLGELMYAKETATVDDFELTIRLLRTIDKVDSH